jgi:membrane protease subunit HflK
MSLNDPQWGKRGNGGGPPDLDEIWRNMNRRMNELFGRRADESDTGGGGRGGPRRTLPSGGAVLLVALVFIVWAASGFYIVDEGRRGVGHALRQVHRDHAARARAGTCPFPIESVEVIDFSQVKTIEIGYRNTTRNKKDEEATMLTDDENIIDVMFAVQYNLKSAEDYVFNNRKPTRSSRSSRSRRSARWSGRSKMDFALYEGRQQIANDTQTLMQTMLDNYRTAWSSRT